MKRSTVRVMAAALALSCGAATAADAPGSLGAAITGGTTGADARLRYENVRQDNALQDADAYTARLRLGYTTAAWHGVDASAEFEGVTDLGDEQYNSTRNGKTAFAVVGDPGGNELNQAWVRYRGIPQTTVTVGRSRLIFDNARFVGNVGWRQNEQTYDGYFVSNTSLPSVTLSYAFLTDVDTVFFTDLRLHAHLANAAWAPAPWLHVTAYGYWLDFEEYVAARRDTQTPGLRLTGAVPAGPGSVGYALEYAHQTHYRDAPATVKADYSLAELGYGVPAISAKLGYEVLGSNGGAYGFQTPLATLHAFQGWADQFLATPATGIRDAYGALGGGIVRIAWQVAYHRFDADAGGAHYGDEFDVQATYPLATGLAIGAKYADYAADTYSVDTRKAWAWTEYRFQ